MNMELLFWAAANGGSSTLYQRALGHLQKVQANHVRNNGSTYQVVEYSTSSGAALARVTNQGYADTSTWARGQAWAIHGFTTAYRYTRTANPNEAASFLATAKLCATYFLDHLPADGIPKWDFDAPDSQKDTSAAAIAAAGLIELAQYDNTRDWRGEGTRLLGLLSTSTYKATSSQAYSLLLHGVSNKPANVGIDVGLTYGDYYYIQGLDRVATLTPPNPTPGVVGSVTLNRVPADIGTGGVVNQDFRTDDVNGTHLSLYRGVLTNGFPTDFQLTFPATGNNEALLEVFNGDNTDTTSVSPLLALTKSQTGTASGATLPMPIRRGDASGSLIRYYGVYDAGTSATAGSRTTWTSATKIAETAAGPQAAAPTGASGRQLTMANGGTVASGALTSASAAVTFNGSLGATNDFGASAICVLRAKGAIIDSTVVQPTSTSGGGGGGGSTPGATEFPIPAPESPTYFGRVDANSLISDYATQHFNNPGSGSTSGMAVASIPPYYARTQVDGPGSSPAYAITASTVAGKYDFYTADGYRSELARPGHFMRVGEQWFWGYTIMFPAATTPIYPRGGKDAAFRTATSSKGDWLDFGQNHAQDSVGAGLNGPFSISLNSGKIELFRNLGSTTSAGDHPYLAPAPVLDKVIYIMYRCRWEVSSTVGIFELWIDFNDGAGLLNRFGGTMQTARDSGQAVDPRTGIYMGPYKPMGATFVYGPFAMHRAASHGTADVAEARRQFTLAAFGASR
jgi:hypothetical protein